jgi:hypothetical protein
VPSANSLTDMPVVPRILRFMSSSVPDGAGILLVVRQRGRETLAWRRAQGDPKVPLMLATPGDEGPAIISTTEGPGQDGGDQRGPFFRSGRR